MSKAKTAKQLTISAARRPYRRAGLDLSAPVTIAASCLSDAQLAALRADPVVAIGEADAAAPEPAAE